MKRKNTVVKFRQRKNINIGAIIFVIIFIYIGANVFLYFTKSHLSIYEVQKGSTTDESVVHGIIIRDEKLIYTDRAGYISYYQKEGERVSKNAKLYSIDESKQVYELMTNNSTFELSDNEMSVIQKDINRFLKKYSDVDFQTVTDFKYDMDNTITEVMYEKMMDNIQDLMDDNDVISDFQVVRTPSSGIVTYHYDNYEELEIKSITKETFDQEKYKRTQLRTTDLIATDQPVCKIIKNENWELVAIISEDQYNKLEERSKIKVTILKDNFTTTVPVTTYTADGVYYARLDFNKYMSNYLDERFLDVELHINNASGLKIPKTTVIEKDFYVIPNSMFCYGGDSNRKGLVVVKYDENGEVTTTFVETNIYYQDEEYSYVSCELFERGTKIMSTKTQETYQLTTVSSLKGVYNVNNGYFVFEKVDIIYENEEYYIVMENVANSISVYDQIALDAIKVIEDAIIY